MCFATVVSVGTTANLRFADTDLLPSTSYTYTVIGIDHGGNESPPSDLASAATVSPDLTPPTPPTGLAVEVGVKSVVLSWSPATDDRGVVRYLLRRDDLDLAELDSNARSYSDRGLTPGTSFDYELIAFDADGNSSDPLAAQITAVTLPPPTGLWAAYGFEDSGPTILDSSIYGNHATLQPPAVRP